MEVLSVILGRDVEEVAASVTLGVLAVNSRGSMEWLMNVTEVVDE